MLDKTGSKVIKKTRKIQDAHEAIRPTDMQSVASNA